jgi:hypothetical protein
MRPGVSTPFFRSFPSYVSDQNSFSVSIPYGAYSRKGKGIPPQAQWLVARCFQDRYHFLKTLQPKGFLNNGGLNDDEM